METYGYVRIGSKVIHVFAHVKERKEHYFLLSVTILTHCSDALQDLLPAGNFPKSSTSDLRSASLLAGVNVQVYLTPIPCWLG